MLSFYIPLIFVLIIYANIYRTAQTAMDNRSSVQMSQFLPHNDSTPNFGPTSLAAPSTLAQQQINGNSCSSPQLPLNASNTMNSISNIDDGSSTYGADQLGGERSLKRTTTPLNDNKTRGLLASTRCLGRRLSTPFNGRLSIFVTRRYSFFRHVHLPNQKAIRTLGVILGTFIVCWLPFMVFAIIKPLYEYVMSTAEVRRPLNTPPWIDSVLLWFGYSSSMLNPLIYSKFNREFRTPFREIFYCRCRGLNEKIRRQEYLENTYGDPHIEATSSVHMHHLQAGTHRRGSGGLAAAV